MEFNFFKKKKINYYLLALFLIFLAGSFFRFLNLNWDSYQIFHPDERNIDNAVTKIIFFRQLNPEFFAYGGFPIYLYRLSGDFLVLITKNKDWVFDWGHINLIGRAYSAFFSSLTILVVYFLSRKYLNKIFSLISAFIFAFSVSSIQISHFATTESLLILISTLVALLSVIYYKNLNIKRSIMLGILSGLGVASKTTALSFLIFPILVFLIFFIKSGRKKILLFLIYVFVFVIFSFATFLLLSPFTFISWGKFIESMRYESGVVWGTLPVPYTHQFDKAIPYLFEIKNLFWQMGPVFFFSIIGLLFLIFLLFKNRKIEYLFLVLFPLTYFLYVGSWHTKFIRYTSLLLPFFAIYASFAFFIIVKKHKKLGITLIFLFLFLTLSWTMAFTTIYLRPQTRLKASLWMYKNIPEGSKILEEHWDDGLPIRIDGYNQDKYNIEQLTIYDNEFNNKERYYASKLSNSDYIILSTRRLYGTLINLPETYPVTSRYYKNLFSGKLGYKKVAEFSSYPSLFGVIVNDDSSEESFQVYDHPKVLIFKNIKKYSKDKILKVL